MRSRMLDDSNGETWVIALDTDEEVIADLMKFAKSNRLFGSRFTAVGALKDVTLASFDYDSKQFKPMKIQEQVEVATMYGDFWISNEQLELRAYAIVARADGTTIAGHLIEGHVRPVLEVTLIESPKSIHRRFDPASGLALIDIRYEPPSL